MDKFSELKRRADKCPIKRFKAFIGKANTQATLCADTGIEIIGWSGFDASDLNAKSHRVELARFIAAADPETILSLLSELEAKDERIAELEAKTAMTMGVGSGNGNLFVHGDYDSIKAAQAIVLENESLRAKLATPVRLPGKTSDLDSWDGGWDACLEECAEAIRAAGYRVEGNE